jgi:hypothetical protein
MFIRATVLRPELLPVLFVLADERMEGRGLCPVVADFVAEVAEEETAVGAELEA